LLPHSATQLTTCTRPERWNQLDPSDAITIKALGTIWTAIKGVNQFGSHHCNSEGRAQHRRQKQYGMNETARQAAQDEARRGDTTPSETHRQ
jgi:hypothetical protein